MGKSPGSGVFSLNPEPQTLFPVLPGITPELLGRLLDEQGGPLALFASQWTDAADDCVQEALIELARQRPVPDNPVAWLFCVVRNRALSRARAARRRQRHELQAWELSGRGSNDAPQPLADPDDVAAALAALDDDLREVIVARTWGGLGFEEIAALVGCSTSTAQRRYVAGLAALRERLNVACPTNTKTKSRTS